MVSRARRVLRRSGAVRRSAVALQSGRGRMIGPQPRSPISVPGCRRCACRRHAAARDQRGRIVGSNALTGRRERQRGPRVGKFRQLLNRSQPYLVPVNNHAYDDQLPSCVDPASPPSVSCLVGNRGRMQAHTMLDIHLDARRYARYRRLGEGGLHPN